MGYAQPALKSFTQLKTKDRTRDGGRSLNAIWASKALSISERALLAFFASQLDFRGNFQEWHYCATRKFADHLGVSRQTVMSILDGLASKGFLEFEDPENIRLARSYRLTSKIFDEYAEQLAQKTPRGQNPLPLAKSCGGQSPLPQLPQEGATPLAKTFSTPERAKDVVVDIGQAREARKTSTREKARAIIASMVRFRPGEFVPFKGLDRTADRLLDKFGIKAFYALEDELAGFGQLGDVPWDPWWIEQALERKHKGLANEV